MFQVFPTTIRQGQKSLQGTNGLAYCLLARMLKKKKLLTPDLSSSFQLKIPGIFSSILEIRVNAKYFKVCCFFTTFVAAVKKLMEVN
jgi:hypothetical protein